MSSTPRIVSRRESAEPPSLSLRIQKGSDVATIRGKRDNFIIN